MLGYLRFEHSILHRDISKGNVLYFKDTYDSSASATSDAQSGEVNKAMEPKEVPLCFIKYLLGERYVEMLQKWVCTKQLNTKPSNDPRKTSALLIDFNNAEDLRSEQGSEHKRTTRTVRSHLDL